MTDIEQLIVSKLDILIEGQHGHDLRLQTLESDLLSRNNRKSNVLRVVVGALSTVIAAGLIVFLGLKR